MASLHPISNFGSGSHGTKFKDSKPKPKAVVKPILKKWSQSEKEKKSLDMDRGWDEQDGQHRSTQGWGRSSSLSFYEQGAAGPDGTAGGVGGAPPGVAGRVGLGVVTNNSTSTRRYNHSRSISGTSHASGTTSNSSNSIPAPRHFVHPFQQTPRTSTPPLLSYANSLASIADTRDYSPTTITEDDDNDRNNNTDNSTSGVGVGAGIAPPSNQACYNNPSHNSSSVCIQHPNHNNSNSLSQPTLTLKHPSLASQHTSSTDISDANSQILPSQPPLRVNTSRTSSSIPAHSSRLANVSSRSDLYLDRLVDSPTSSIPPTIIASPSSSMAPMSPLRSSLDGGFSRMRSKSDVDTATRAEHLRAARRKFEIKERLKDEKFAREEIKRRERADTKRAHELEKQLAAQYKEHLAARAREEAAELEEALQRGKHNRKISVASSGRPSLSITRPSISLGRPSTSRKNASGHMSESEKFMTSSYESTDPLNQPTSGREAGSMHFTQPKRKNTAKRKTHGAWTAFILWLRTKLLRMGKK
ncbi:hypothetical protein GGS24DRAFT_78514 [Hypoxylon argillaceum]|nr:hypothetical protein GGS24DRAFT_78514 [Hypoxylon argillaceum]